MVHFLKFRHLLQRSFYHQEKHALCLVNDQIRVMVALLEKIVTNEQNEKI